MKTPFENAPEGLTWEDFQAGAPCPGCGRPWRDEEPWEFRGTIYFTDDERARYEAEKRRFKADHPECGMGRQSLDGSLTVHCLRCCPPPPLSPQQRENVGRIFLNV